MVRFLAAHVILGLAVFASPSSAQFHFWATAAIGIWISVSTRRQSDIALMAAYVVGAEVLWRMSHAALFWETGKYFVSAIALLGLVRFPRVRSMKAPFVYFVLLLPGVMMLGQTVVNFSFFREQVSFYVSGPFSLAVASCFFRQLTLSRNQLSEMLVAVLGPVTSIAVLTVLSTYTASNIVFRVSSNFEASWGFGPNQVSAALSLGAMLCFLVLATRSELGILRRIILFVMLAVCAVQSAMTFSRAGLYMMTISIAGASLCMLGDRSARRLVAGIALASVVVFGIIAPRLSSFTGGAVGERFQNLDPSGRVELLQGDLEVWAEQPVLGAGVGQAELRVLGRPDTRTHTEWTRMLAEHGIPGLISMLVLIVMMAGNISRAPGAMERAAVVCLVLWSATYLAVNDMRMVAPSFLIGLSCAAFEFPAGWRPLLRRRRFAARPSTLYS